jgi:hypothetical protein
MNRFALGTFAVAALALTATGCKAGVHVGAASPASAAPVSAGSTPGGPDTSPSAVPVSGAGGAGSGTGTGNGTGTGSGTGTVTVTGKSGGAGAVVTPRCHSAGFHVVVTGYNAGAGSRFAKLLFTNLSGHSCKVYGWPGLGLGTTSEGFGGAVVRQGSPASFVIPAGGHAYTLLRWSAVPASDENQSGDCEAVATVLQVIPPDETEPLVAAWSGGAACQHNQLTTTPLTAGPGA